MHTFTRAALAALFFAMIAPAQGPPSFMYWACPQPGTVAEVGWSTVPGDDFYALWMDYTTVCGPSFGLSSCRFPTTPGGHTLQVNGRDPAGNWYSQTLALTCQGPPPPPPQFTSISCPVPGTTAQASWNLVPGDDFYSLWLDNNTVCGPSVNMASCSFPATPGNHTLQINGRRPDGNWYSAASNMTCTDLPDLPAVTTFLPEIVGRPAVDADSVLLPVTGPNIVLPTIDYPGLTMTTMTSEGTNLSNGSVVYQNDTFTTTIQGLDPFAPIYINVHIGDFGVLGAGQAGDTNWCGVVFNYHVSDGSVIDPDFYCSPYGPTSLTPYCADANGSFSISGSYAGMRATSWTERWNSTYAGGVFADVYTSYFVAEPGGAVPPTSDSRTFTTTNGVKKTLKRGDNIRATASANHKQTENGKYRYEFTIDTRDVQLIRVGDTVDFLNLEEETSEPKGWISAGMGWGATPTSERSDKSQFTLTSDWMPGPVSILMQGETSPPSEVLTGLNANEAFMIATEMGIERNSKKRTVIGPAIPPNVTEAQLRTLLKTWVTNQNLGLLQAMSKDGADLKSELDKLNPQTEIERQIRDCISVALGNMR